MAGGERAGRRLSLPAAPAEIFVWTRAAIWVVVPLAVLTLNGLGRGPFGTPATPANTPHDVGWAVDLWGRWDGGWFLRIAEHGYQSPHVSTAFFPLYPLLVRVVGFVLGRHYLLGGVLVSTAACLAAFVLLYRLAGELLDRDSARRAVLAVAVFPTTFFLGAVYSESLYLALSVAVFLFAVRGRWLTAGVAAGLALLTRSAGIALLPSLALLAWRAPNPRAALTRSAIALPIAALWPLWQWIKLGDPFLFLRAQSSEEFGRHVSQAGPLGGAWHGLVAAWHGLRQLFSSHANFFPNATDHAPSYTAAVNLEQFGFAVLVLALGVYAWRRLGAAYGLVVLLSLVLPLSAPTQDYPLLSMSRFALATFPIFLALGELGRRPRVATAILAISSILLGLELARWALYDFVA
jgi:hypothetical protein